MLKPLLLPRCSYVGATSLLWPDPPREETRLQGPDPDRGLSTTVSTTLPCQNPRIIAKSGHNGSCQTRCMWFFLGAEEWHECCRRSRRSTTVLNNCDNPPGVATIKVAIASSPVDRNDLASTVMEIIFRRFCERSIYDPDFVRRGNIVRRGSIRSYHCRVYVLLPHSQNVLASRCYVNTTG